MIDENLRRFIESIPKADLHVHLDSVPPEVLLRLAERNGVELPFRTVEEFNTWYVLEDLEDFMRKYTTMTSVLRTEEDYRDVAHELGRIMKRQNVLRCEAMFTYAAAHEGRVALDVVLGGLARGRRAVRDEFGVDLYFLADIDRTISPERSLQFIDDIVPYKDEVGILGVGFDCQETGYPAGPHKAAFERARDHGLLLSAHAGEESSAGPEAVWEVIESVAPDRIDHGNQAIGDDELVTHLAEAQIPLTLCPMSNVAIQVYRDVGEHPIMALRDRGVFVTLNSDDITMMGCRNDLTFNYTSVADAFGLSYGDIAGLARNGFLASYASEADKARYLAQLDGWLSQNMP
jgi:adenosine deaminase